MSLSIGIVGLTNVGKSTLFEALTKKQVDISNYPFCTIEPNVGIVEVPDERLAKLTKVFPANKKVPAIVKFVDIAGLVRGAHQGEGLGNQFLAHIREVDAVLFVVRCFENPEITHVEKTVDPLRDIDIVNMELIFKDLETLDKRIQKAAIDAKSGKRVIADELEALKNLKAALEKGASARQFIEQNPKLFNENTLKELQLLTAKPCLFILNSNTPQIPPDLEKKMQDLACHYLVANLKDEYDASKFSEEEKKELGLPESKLDEIIKKSYQILGLITFFSILSNEVHAWTIKQGTKAPQAAGVIHTDFENKFICANVINWEKLVRIGQEKSGQDAWGGAAKSGLLRTEGKEYIVQDGDVIEAKHGQ